MTNHEARDSMIGAARQQQEVRRTEETLIAQKVNRAHREAFHAKFPGQIEHCMRLVAERLQTGLRKDQPVPLTEAQIENLAHALAHLYQIHLTLEA